MKRILSLIIAASLLLTLHSPSVIAENLSEIFELARKNDPEWAAKKQKFLAEREKMEQAFAGLMPSANLTAVMGKQYYEGGTTSLTFDEFFACGSDNGFATANGDGTSTLDIGNALGPCQDKLIGTTDVSQDYTFTNFSVNAVQPIIRMDRWYRYKKAQNYDNAAKANLAFDQQALMIRSAEAYFGVLRASEELQLAKSEEKTLRTQLTEIKNRYKLGIARDTDVFEIQAQHDIAKAGVIVAESQLESFKENLLLITGKYIEVVNPLPRSIPIEPPQPYNIADWEEFAKKNNYQLLAAQYSSAAATQERKEKNAGHAPTVDVYATYTHNDVGGGFSPSSDTTTVGLKFEMPLYSGGATSSQVREAEYRVQESNYNREFALRNSLRETRQYYTRVNADVASVQARLRAVKSNNSSLRAMKAGWADGIRSLSDTLAAQRKVYQAKKEYTVSRYDYIINTLKLKKAAGVLAPNDLETLNSWLDGPGTKTVSTILDNQEPFLEQVDNIKFERELKTFEDEQKEAKKSHKSLYDAFKAWNSEPNE